MALFSGEEIFPVTAQAYNLPVRGFYEFVIEPKSFLEEYLNKGLKKPNPLGDTKSQELFELMLQEQNPVPGFRVDPLKLDLNEFRAPGPAYPGEDLDRDRFLRSAGSPLSLGLTY